MTSKKGKNNRGSFDCAQDDKSFSGVGFVESHPKRKDRDALRMGTLGWWVSLRKSGFPSGMTSKKGNGKSKKGKNHG